MQALARRSYREIAAGLLDERRQLGFPPCASVVMFRADAVELDAALAELEAIRKLLTRAPGFGDISCVGPLPALMTRRIGRYRAQLCLLSRERRALRAVLSAAMPEIAELPRSARVNWTVDVDAYDL